jgi:hypothetical protein
VHLQSTKAVSGQGTAASLEPSQAAESHGVWKPIEISSGLTAEHAAASFGTTSLSEGKKTETMGQPEVTLHLVSSPDNAKITIHLEITRACSEADDGEQEASMNMTDTGPRLPVQDIYTMLKDQMQDRAKGHFALFSDLKTHLPPARFIEYGESFWVPVDTSTGVSWQCFVGTVLHCLHR